MKNKILMLALSILVGFSLSDTLSAQTNCDCEFIETMITQDVSTRDTAVFYLSLHNRTDTSCFESVIVVVDTGFLFNWTVLSPSWIVVQIDVQTLHINHTSGRIPSGISVPLRLTVSSDFDKYVFTTQTTYADPILQGSTCPKSFTLTDEQSAMNDCCPPDLSIAGPEMVMNGSFNAGNTGFQTDYIYWDPNFNIPPGGYSIHNATTLYNANDEWFCVGRRGTPDDYFLAVDCAPGLTELAAWRQSFLLDKDSTYAFCGYFNNLVLPKLDYLDPTIELWLVSPDSSKTRLFFYTLEETPDQWIKLESTIQVPADGTYQLEIWCLGGLNNGYDFAMDEVSLRTCQPDFICDISPSVVVEQIGCNRIKLFPGATGQVPISYQWSDGSTEQDRVLLLNCGNYTYCLTVTDANGCEADTCLFFSIIDNDPPTASCPDPDTLYLPADRCYFTPAELPTGSVEDNCLPGAGILLSLIVNGVPQTILNDDQFPPGDYALLATPIDFCNNVGQSCSFLLTISSLDTIKPVLECPLSDAYAGETNSEGLCTRLFDFSNLIANDLCGIAEQTWSVSGSTIGQGAGAPGLLTLQEGTSFLTVTAKDFAGNTFSCNVALTVSCDICTCGGLSNLQYSNPVNGTWESFTCIADTLKANCLVGETWSVTGTVACSGEDCIDADVPVYWELYDPAQSLAASGIVTANPNFLMDIPSTTFDQLGYYFLVVRMKCGGDWCNCGAYVRSSCGEIICDNNFVQNGNFESGTPPGSDESICFANHWCGIWPKGQNSTGDYYNLLSGPIWGSNVVLFPAAQEKVGGFWCRLQQDQTIWREGIMNELSAPIPAQSGKYSLKFRLACILGTFGQPILDIFGVNTTGLATATPPLNGNFPLNENLFQNTTPVRLASYPLPATCDEFFQTVTLEFDAGILQEDITHLFFTRSDDIQNQTGGTYLVIDEVCLQLKEGVGAVESEQSSGFIMYPNPAEENVFIALNGSQYSDASVIRFLDISGKVVYQQSLNHRTEHNLSISSLPKGFYVVQVLSGNKVLGIRKLVRG